MIAKEKEMADISCAECGAGVVVVNGWIEVLDHDTECVWADGGGNVQDC